jgi:hypothetical protein
MINNIDCLDYDVNIGTYHPKTSSIIYSTLYQYDSYNIFLYDCTDRSSSYQDEHIEKLISLE